MQVMDPQKCLDILCRRARCEHGGTDSLKFCSACNFIPPTATSNIDSSETASSSSSGTSEREGGKNGEDEDGEFANLSKLEMANLFCALQSQRVQGYADYSTALDVLIEEVRIGEYSALCGEMTARFSVISNKIIKLQRKIRKEGLVDIANLIQKVYI